MKPYTEFNCLLNRLNMNISGRENDDEKLSLLCRVNHGKTLISTYMSRKETTLIIFQPHQLIFFRIIG